MIVSLTWPLWNDFHDGRHACTFCTVNSTPSLLSSKQFAHTSKELSARVRTGTDANLSCLSPQKQFPSRGEPVSLILLPLSCWEIERDAGELLCQFSSAQTSPAWQGIKRSSMTALVDIFISLQGCLQQRVPAGACQEEQAGCSQHGPPGVPGWRHIRHHLSL